MENYYETPLWEDEIWKPVVGYEGYYEVSNLGNVRRMSGIVKIGCNTRRWKSKLLKQFNIGDYLGIELSKNGIRKKYLVHRLVAQAFLPNPDNLPCVNHKDEVKSNNNIENLEWCDEKYNMNYGTKNYRMVETRIRNGFNDSHRSHLNKKESQRLWYLDNRDRILEKMKKQKVVF